MLNWFNLIASPYLKIWQPYIFRAFSGLACAHYPAEKNQKRKMVTTPGPERFTFIEKKKY